MGGAATTGASGAGGKSGSGGQGGATTGGGGKGGASGSGGGGHAGASGSGGTGMGGTGMGGRGTGGTGVGGTGMGGTGMGGTGIGGGNVDAGPDASVDCNALRMDVDATLAAAQKCDATVTMGQCQDVVAGVCCPVAINSKSSPEGMAYLAALDRYRATPQCRTICPLIACRTGTPQCVASAGNGTGQCVLLAIPPPL
jgi:hypothetical protein